MSRVSRHAAPVVVQAGSPAVSLQRFEPGSGEGWEREEFIQKLVHDHPNVIPMLDIEPAFTPLISICRELPISSGSLDNFWLTPEGGIVLGECKLMKNPQARREVVAQALDYARAVSGLHYAELEEAVQNAECRAADTMWEAVSAKSDLEEPQFIDAVERRLRVGRFMILIIGDGIQEGVEEITDFLQLHAGLHTGLALVDLSIWQVSEGRHLIVPRIPAKTTLVERGIVKVGIDGTVRVEPPASTAPSVKTQSKAVTVSEPEYLAQIEQHVPGVTDPIQDFLSKVTRVGIEPEFKRSLVLRFYPSPDGKASAGFIEAAGRVELGDAWYYADRLGKSEVGERYLKTVADLIGGTVGTYEKRASLYVKGRDGKTPHICDLLSKRDKWVDAIAVLVRELHEPG